MATAFAVVIPFFFLGDPSGHDFEFHLNSWMEVLHQWQLGIVYPRWAAFAHYSYGEARFLFYPPASWTLGAFLGAILPWKVVPGAYVFVVLTLSGGSMFLLARRWLDRNDAIFAAALYAANPYSMVVVYWRSAFAELLAGALLPLLLLWILRTEEDGPRTIVPLGLIVAGAWLTNVPAAVMVNYSLALLLVVVAIVRRSPRALLYGGMAVALGTGLAAFFVFPAAYEQKWVNIAEVLSPGVRPQDNFLFTVIDDADHNRFNLLVSVVSSVELTVLAGAAFLSWERREVAPARWWTVMTWAAAATALMFPFTFFAWEHFPELRFVQLPWRWLLCLNVALALLVTMAFRRWVTRALICLMMLAVLWVVWHRVQAPWWDTAADIAEMQQNIEDGPGYEGTDEYVARDADPYEIKQEARRVVLDGDGQAQIHVLQWDPELKVFTAKLSQPGKLVLRMFNYPAWQVEVNGWVFAAQTQEVTGQMVIPLAAGKSEVRVRFVRTWDRTAGGIVSLLTVSLMIVLLMYRRDLLLGMPRRCP